MWEGMSLPHDTKFGNCRCKIVDSRSFPSWSLIHGLRWSGLIKVGPGLVARKVFRNNIEACLRHLIINGHINVWGSMSFRPSNLSGWASVYFSSSIHKLLCSWKYWLSRLPGDVWKLLDQSKVTPEPAMCQQTWIISWSDLENHKTSHNKWVLYQKQVSRAGTSNYLPQILWDVIMCPSPWYRLLAHHSSKYL